MNNPELYKKDVPVIREMVFLRGPMFSPGKKGQILCSVEIIAVPVYLKY